MIPKPEAERDSTAIEPTAKGSGGSHLAGQGVPQSHAELMRDVTPAPRTNPMQAVLYPY